MSFHLSLSLKPHVIAIFTVLNDSTIDLSHCHDSLGYYFSEGLVRADDQLRDELGLIGTFHADDAHHGVPARIVGTWAESEGSVEKVTAALERVGIKARLQSCKTFRMFTRF